MRFTVSQNNNAGGNKLQPLETITTNQKYLMVVVGIAEMSRYQVQPKKRH